MNPQQKALAEALEPFAKAADIRLCGEWSSEKSIQGTDIAFHITFGDLRRARAAYASTIEKPAAVEGQGEPTSDEIIDIINVVTDLSEADALDKAYPEIYERLCAYSRRVSALAPAPGREGARLESDWHEDMGDVLWWAFPIVEAPWVGTPLTNTWPGYHTHFTPLPPLPEVPTAGEEGGRDG